MNLPIVWSKVGNLARHLVKGVLIMSRLEQLSIVISILAIIISITNLIVISNILARLGG